jgi:hypothetical protein
MPDSKCRSSSSSCTNETKSSESLEKLFLLSFTFLLVCFPFFFLFPLHLFFLCCFSNSFYIHFTRPYFLLEFGSFLAMVLGAGAGELQGARDQGARALKDVALFGSAVDPPKTHPIQSRDGLACRVNRKMMRAQPSRSVGLKRNVSFEKHSRSQPKKVKQRDQPSSFLIETFRATTNLRSTYMGAVMRNNRRRLAQLGL